MTLPRPIIAAAILLWLWSGRFCCAGEPQLVLGWSIANSGPDIGSTREEMRDGWPAFIKKYVLPGVEWAKEAGIEPAIYIAHPFGQYATQADDAMHLDGWDYAKAAGATHLTNNFATDKGWKQLTDKVPCYAYLGGVHLTARLRDLPPAELAATIRRNLKPIADAGFRGVYIDWAENAIVHPFRHETIASQSTGRSLDAITLEIADGMFPERTGVESAPRSFKDFRLLWSRNVVLEESQWQHRFGASRHREFKALGYDRSKLTGRMWRTLDYRDDPASTLEQARAVIADGDVPVLNPLPFIVNGVKASELVNNWTGAVK